MTPSKTITQRSRAKVWVTTSRTNNSGPTFPVADTTTRSPLYRPRLRRKDQVVPDRACRNNQLRLSRLLATRRRSTLRERDLTATCPICPHLVWLPPAETCRTGWETTVWPRLHRSSRTIRRRATCRATRPAHLVGHWATDQHTPARQRTT